MSLYKSAGSRFWWVAVYRKGMKQLRRSTGTEDRAQAEAIEAVIRLAQARTSPADRLHRMIDELAGEVTERPGLPLAGIWPEYSAWTEASGAGLAEHTLRDRSAAVRRFVEWAGEHWRAAATAEAVDRACAAGFARHLANNGAKSKTRKNVLSDLSTVWSGLMRTRDGLGGNPWRLVIPEVRDSERGSAFTPEQEAAVIAAADAAGRGWGLACRISRYTGLRYGDVARLRWADVDLAGGWIATAPAKTGRHGISVRIPIAKPLRQALEEARGKAQEGAEHVMPPEQWRHYPRQSVRYLCPFKEVLRRAGVAGPYSFHSWRHTFRTRLSEAGVSDDLAKRLGGWTEDATAARYDHAARAEDLRRAVESGARQSRGGKAAAARAARAACDLRASSA